jgi:uncharacterized protein DUF6585
MGYKLKQGTGPAGHELIPDEPPEALYRSQHSIVSMAYIAIGVALVFLEIWLVQQVLDGQIRGKMAMIPWLMPIVIGFLLVLGTINLLSPITVAVYPHGFAYQKGRQVDFCTWDRIATFWSHRKCVEGAAPNYKYWVTRDDGAVFAFKSNRVNNVEELAGRIYTNVRDRLFPAALVAYSAGQPVEFGPIAIDRDGLTYRDEHLSWGRMDGIPAADADSDFVVKKQGNTYAWCELSTARIPNFLILQELLDEVFAAG